MDLTRRRFVLLGAAAVAAGIEGSVVGVQVSDSRLNPEPRTLNPPPPPPPPPEEPPAIVDAGPLEDFPEAGVYDQFRTDGFFIIRRDERLWAMSSICTHRGCKVRAQPDDSFFCRCHRSAFDSDGRVVDGPAPRPLPRLAVTTDERNHVLVHRGRSFDPHAPDRSER